MLIIVKGDCCQESCLALNEAGFFVLLTYFIKNKGMKLLLAIILVIIAIILVVINPFLLVICLIGWATTPLWNRL